MNNVPRRWIFKYLEFYEIYGNLNQEFRLKTDKKEKLKILQSTIQQYCECFYPEIIMKLEEDIICKMCEEEFLIENTYKFIQSSSEKIIAGIIDEIELSNKNWKTNEVGKKFEQTNCFKLLMLLVTKVILPRGKKFSESKFNELRDLTFNVKSVPKIRHIFNLHFFNLLYSIKEYRTNNNLEELEEYINTGIKLGGGGFATVYLGYGIESGMKVALKDIKLEIYKNIKKENLIEIEWENMKTLKGCPQVLRLLNVYEIRQVNSNDLFKKIVITEFCDEDLHSFIKSLIKQTKFQTGVLLMPEKWVSYFISEIVSAFRAMQEHKIIHRDLKPDNILLIHDQFTWDNFSFDTCQNFPKVKIADFGLSKNVHENTKNYTIAGTPEFMAPELIDLEDSINKLMKKEISRDEILKKNYNSKCDIWSLGVVMHLLLFGSLPLVKNNFFILNENQKSLISKDCSDLLCSMLKTDPRIRIDWNDLFKHPFLNVSMDSYEFQKLSVIKDYQK